jgi:asparagine synthetase B (glutamine-hydrolysing)
VLYDKLKGKLYLTADPSALFPLYYTIQDQTLVFSSHLHILAHSLGACMDDLGVLQMTTLKHTLGERTLYSNIQRLPSGQSLIYDVAQQRIERVDHPEYFQETVDSSDTDAIAEHVWQTLVQACVRVGKIGRPIGVMLSGGLDSRMVVAGMSAASIPIVTCTHGQEGFHEVDVSRRVAEVASAPHHLVDLGHGGFIGSMEDLERVFWSSDYMFFPVWRLGSRLLRDQGACALTSGYALDATLGGHFHDPQDPRVRLLRRLRYAIRGPQSDMARMLSQEDYLRQYVSRVQKRVVEGLNQSAWVFNKEYYAQLLEVSRHFEDDLLLEIERIMRTGTRSPAKVIDRLVSENHLRKYSFSQELVARADLPVVVPTYDRDLIRLLSSLDSVSLLDHYMYFKVIRRFAPEFARIPSSSSALPVSYPSMILEIARLCRNRYDHFSRRIQMRTAGKMHTISKFAAMSFEDVARMPGGLDTLELALGVDGKSCLLDRVAVGERIEEIRCYKRRAFNLTEYTTAAMIKFSETLP